MWMIDEVIMALRNVGTHLDTERQMNDNLAFAYKQLKLEIDKLPKEPNSKGHLTLKNVEYFFPKNYIYHKAKRFVD